MTALYRATLRRMLTSIPTVVCTALFMLCQGLLISLFNLSTGSSALSGALSFMVYPIALLLPVPILISTKPMRNAAVRARLASLPVSTVGCVAAHYLAAMTLYVIALSPLFLSPIVFSMAGTVNIGTFLAAVLGCLLLGGAVSALATAAGLLFRRTRVGVFVTYGAVAVWLALYFAPSVLPLPTVLSRALTAASPFAAYAGFLHGQIFVGGLVTLLLAILLALSVPVLALLADRKGTARGLSAAVLALSLVCPAVLGGLTPLLPRNAAYVDVTGSETFTVSGVTKDYLRTVDTDVRIYYLCRGGERSAYFSLVSFLECYRAESDRISVTYVDTDRDGAFAARYTAAPLSDHSLIVESDTRHFVIDAASLYHYYNAAVGQSFSAQYYSHCLDAADYYASTGGSFGSYDETAVEYGSALYLYSDQTVAYFDGDALLTNAILYVCSRDVPTVQLLCGNGSPLESNLRSILISKGYFFKDVAKLDDLSGCDLLLIHSPSRDLDPSETEALSAYLASGGKLFLASSCEYNDFPNLLTVLNAYGMDTDPQKNILCQKTSGKYSIVFAADVNKSSAASASFSGTVAMIMPHRILLRDVDGVTHTEWITTSSAGSYLYRSELAENTSIPEDAIPTVDARADKHPCGVIAERGDSAVVWLSSALSMGLTGYSYSAGGNYELVRAALDHLTQNAFAPLTIAPATIEPQTLSLTAFALALSSIAFILLIPTAFALPAALRIYLRRKR